jgi:hypothetical protein
MSEKDLESLLGIFRDLESRVDTLVLNQRIKNIPSLPLVPSLSMSDMLPADHDLHNSEKIRALEDRVRALESQLHFANEDSGRLSSHLSQVKHTLRRVILEGHLELLRQFAPWETFSDAHFVNLFLIALKDRYGERIGKLRDARSAPLLSISHSLQVCINEKDPHRVPTTHVHPDPTRLIVHGGRVGRNK